MSEGTQDVVARLRADRPVTQFDSAGRTIRFDGTPSKLESEAADIIAALSTESRRLRETLEKIVNRTESVGYWDDKIMQDIARAALSPASEE